MSNFPLNNPHQFLVFHPLKNLTPWFTLGTVVNIPCVLLISIAINIHAKEYN